MRPFVKYGLLGASIFAILNAIILINNVVWSYDHLPFNRIVKLLFTAFEFIIAGLFLLGVSGKV